MGGRSAEWMLVIGAWGTPQKTIPAFIAFVPTRAQSYVEQKMSRQSVGIAHAVCIGRMMGSATNGASRIFRSEKGEVSHMSIS